MRESVRIFSLNAWDEEEIEPDPFEEETDDDLVGFEREENDELWPDTEEDLDW